MKEIAMIKSETGRATIVFCGEGQDLELIQADGTREPIEANPESLRDAYQTVWAWYGSIRIGTWNCSESMSDSSTKVM